MFSLIVSYDLPAFDYARRDLARIHRVAGTKAMEWFVRERLQKRFTGELRTQLNFERRDGWYNVVKRELGIPVVDHRWRGASKEAAKLAVPGATARKISAKIDGLSMAYGRHREPTKPDSMAELRRMLPEEVDRIAEIYMEQYRDGIMERIQSGPSTRGRPRRGPAA
jgi:hypothetical protein